MASQNSKYTDRVNALSTDDFNELQLAVRTRTAKEETGFATFDEASSLFRGAPICPECQSKNVYRDGLTSLGRQRFRCASCSNSFSYLIGTIFENNRKNYPTWVDFLTYSILALPVAQCAQLCHVTNQTAYEWRRRIFNVVSAFQKNTVLSGRIYIDDICLVLPSYKLGFDNSDKDEIKIKKTYALVAIGPDQHPVAIALDTPNPTSANIAAALADYVEEGSTLIVRTPALFGKLAKKTKSTVVSFEDSDYDDSVEAGARHIMNYGNLFKSFIPCIGSYKVDKLQPHLDWISYLFWLNRRDEEQADVEAVLRHLMYIDALYSETCTFGETE